MELCSREDAYVVDLDRPACRVGCIIMASGLGKRFCGNKLMADFHGKPMILRAIEASEAFASHRVVVTRHPEVADLCRELGVQVILHDQPHRSDTIRLGLEALADVDGCFFLPGDQPLLRRETMEAMVSQWEKDQESIQRPVHRETPGAPILFPRWTFPELLTLPEGKGGGWLLPKYPEHVKGFEVDDPFQLMDVDTPETLRFLEEK
ncbi:MAG: nucleotidyltransferase family protein [Firmicutes bacterium]|nr:nucleotidyltransferase family protein [Bacillota bacterium]